MTAIYVSCEWVKCLPATAAKSSLTRMACWPVGKRIYLPASAAIRLAIVRMANPAACREIPRESLTLTWKVPLARYRRHSSNFINDGSAQFRIVSDAASPTIVIKNKIVLGVNR